MLSGFHKSRANSDNRCFFKFMLNGSVTEQVIFQLDSVHAPDMVSAFLDYCTRSWVSGDGYLGTTVKVCYLYNFVITCNT